ncbi:hypothetical protein [Chryseobacterium sp. ISL-6]|uniref:hypothetical protein n=1 Tax=Chryseobacterium sp. ISL-6 TaxID=2819143 RepID=UPI001BE590A5|nr:hypothetical protein [Chryseobacterium sp. ISL-6]MBT2620897.1 hypothetical protein [Chryseobacterium sp. ISL-6]
MKSIWIVFFFLFGLFLNAQNLEKIVKEVKEEGVDLYRSEMASWYGTDVFKENYTNMENVGGYFSYVNEAVPKCVFFSKSNKVLATISFPTNYNPQDAKVDLNERDFTEIENDYFKIRQNALERIKNDTIFKHYKNTNLNLVPIIKNNIKKVYVLTGPSMNNVVIFGNDYLITFNHEGNVRNVEKLHKGIIIQNINDEKVGKTIAGAHSHVLENWSLITPTDICTLMLYYKFTKWDDYTVISKEYVSVWNGKSNNLSIEKKEKFKKVAENILNGNRQQENIQKRTE